MTEIVGNCFLCGQERKLICAHILPKAYGKFLKDDDEKASLFYSNGSEQMIENLPFDKNLFCAECDNSFSSSEKELIRFTDYLFGDGLEVDFKEVGCVDVLVDCFDVSRIQRALLFLLYKLTMNSRCEVDLERPFETRLKQMLRSGKVDSSVIGVYLTHYLRSEKFSLDDGHKRVFHPLLDRYEINGISFFSILLPGALAITYRIGTILVCSCKMGVNFSDGLCSCQREINQNPDHFYLQMRADASGFDDYIYPKLREVVLR